MRIRASAISTEQALDAVLADEVREVCATQAVHDVDEGAPVAATELLVGHVVKQALDDMGRCRPDPDQAVVLHPTAGVFEDADGRLVPVARSAVLGHPVLIRLSRKTGDLVITLNIPQPDPRRVVNCT